jgi:hypothetical protein
LKSYVFLNLTPLVRWKSTDVSEEHVTSIFRVEAKKETGLKQVADSMEQVMLISCLAYLAASMVVATCLSETSADFQQISRRYIQEDGTLNKSAAVETCNSASYIF